MEDYESFEEFYKNVKESSKLIAKTGEFEFYILDDIFIHVVDLKKEGIESFDIESDDRDKLFVKFGNSDILTLIKYYSTWKQFIPDLKYDEFQIDLKEFQKNKHIVFLEG